VTELARMTVAEELGAGEPAVAASDVVVRLLDPAAQFYVTGGAPLEANARDGDDPARVWLAPDRALWVALARGYGAPGGAFVTDVTDGLALFELSGSRAIEMLAMGCTLDPRDAALAPGCAAQTVFAGVKLVLYARDTGGSWRLHVERSVAAYLLEWFRQAVEALR
jgi:heterotetrameric sarcosine oxidase gamma subunit